MKELILYGSLAVLFYYYVMNVLVGGLMRWLDWGFWYRRIYLNSWHWKLKRWQKKFWTAVEFGAVRCERCGNVHNLQIHHITYKHLYREPLSDLQVLCGTCHRKGSGKI